jgi:hypothetical protein
MNSIHSSWKVYQIETHPSPSVEAIIPLCLGVVGQLDVCVVHVALVSIATAAGYTLTLNETPCSKVACQTLARDGVFGGNEFDVGSPVGVEHGKVHTVSLMANTVDLEAVFSDEGCRGGRRCRHGASG